MTEYKSDILAEADKIIHGERNEQYGKAEDAFDNIADLWNVYIGQQWQNDDGVKLGYCYQLNAHDVAIMMILLKIARTQGTKKKDNYVDIAGYAALAARL